MRTVPAYLLWLIVLLVLLPPLDPVVHFATYMAFAQNLAWPFPADGWFAVSWSLTVEEWFYFLFSAMMFAFVNAVGRRGAPLTILVFLIAPLFLRTIMPDAAQWDASIRKTVLLRLDAIAYGVALALWMRRSAFLDRYWQGALVVGLGLLALAIGNWQFRTGVWEIEGRFWRSLIFSFTSIGFALVFPAFLRFSATPGPTVTVITAVSTYSYGAYLVHYSILERLAPWMSGSVPLCITILGIAGVLTFALAYISFRFVERPILARRPIQRWMDKPGRYDLIG